MKLHQIHKKPSFKIILPTILIFGVIGMLLLIFTKAATPTANFSLTPSSTSVNNGSSITVVVKEDSAAQPVFSVGLILAYDATKFDVASVTNTGDAFPNCPDLNGSGGQIKISCYISPSSNPSSVTGPQNIANITLTAKVGGSVVTPLTFVGPASADYGIFSSVDSSNIWNGDVITNKGSYTLLTPDTTPPVVSITAPAAASTIVGSKTINVSATDNSGTVTKVEFYVNGALKNTDTLPPYSYSWDTTNPIVADGTYSLTAKAYDGATTVNVGTSPAVSVNVLNAKPNLIVNSITLNPAAPITGNTVNVSAVIKNTGTLAIAAGTSKSISVSVDSSVLPTVVDTQAIAVGGSITVNFPTNWIALAGTHNFVVTADKTGLITETSELDNDLTKSIIVYTQGDVDNNGTVSLADINLILSHWGQAGQIRTSGDLNGDGTVSLADLNQVLLYWTR